MPLQERSSPAASQPQELLEGLLAAEVADPREALRTICGCHDLSAAHAAHRCLAPRVGISAADDAFKHAQKDFERRKTQVVARARPLSARSSVDAALQAAETSLATDPATAELRLREALRATEAVERNDLAALERAYPRSKSADARWHRFEDALREGNLRLAHIYAARLGELAAAAGGEPADDWTGSVSDRKLISWLLDPAIAPGWLPRAQVQEEELLLLTALRDALEDVPLGESAARGLAEVMLRFLSVEEACPAAESFAPLAPAAAMASEESSAFEIRCGEVNYLFPHLAGGGAVTLLIPRHPEALLPEPADTHLVAIDLFGAWQVQGGAETLLVTPRMLLQLVPLRRDRRKRFVALVSHSIPVPLLINRFLDQKDYRARLIANENPSGIGLVDRSFVQQLVNGLDLYVDEGDIDALHDASGANLPLLLRILKLIGKTLGSPPPDERRLDALSFLISPEGEAAVENLIQEYVEEQFGRTWRDLSNLVKDVSFELELQQSPGGETSTITSLAHSMVADEAATTPEAAEKEIRFLLNVGLLEEAESNASTGVAILRQNPTLLYRMLMRE